MHVLEALVKCE